MIRIIKGFLRFVLVSTGILIIFLGFFSVGMGKSSIYIEKYTISEAILIIIFILSVAMVLFLIAAWIKKRKTLNIKKEIISIFLKGLLIYLMIIIANVIGFFLAKIYR